MAEHAGVSTATVSHVINKTRYVSKEVTKRVNDSIGELKYYPNHLVGGLRSKKSNTIGIVIPSISNEIFGALTERIQKIFFSMDYNIILCNTSYDCDLEERALETLIMKQADAIIIIPVDAYTKKMNEIQERGTPIILVDRVYKDVKADNIRVDNYLGEYEIVSYLISLGHRRIGYIDRQLEQSHSRDQKNGYIQALADNGIEYDAKYVINAKGHDFLSGAEAVKRLMKRCKDITAISAYYDVIAFGAMRGLIDLGYSIPQDVSVVGYDGMKFSDVTYPRLTTVLTPVKTMAEKICSLILERLKEKYNEDEKKDVFEPADIIIKPKLMIRESCRSI